MRVLWLPSASIIKFCNKIIKLFHIGCHLTESDIEETGLGSTQTTYKHKAAQRSAPSGFMFFFVAGLLATLGGWVVIITELVGLLGQHAVAGLQTRDKVSQNGGLRCAAAVQFTLVIQSGATL